MNSGRCRQWTFFPKSLTCGFIAAPQTFRLLVESGQGRILIANVSLRAFPDDSMSGMLAALVDEHAFAEAPIARLQGEFEARHGHSLELLDIDLDRDDPLPATAIVARNLAKYALTVGRREIAMPLSAFRAAVQERFESEWCSVRDAFIAGLDPIAVGEARASGAMTPSNYGYVKNLNAIQRRNRAQAVAVFPLLRPRLMERNYECVRSVIDAGQPLIDVLALEWQVPKAMVRLLRGVEPSNLGWLRGDLATVLRLLRDIPPDWWPRTPEAWNQFTRAADAIRTLTRRPVTVPANQLWLRQSARAGYAVGDAVPEELLRMGEEIEDFMDMLRRALVWTFAGARKTQPGFTTPRVAEVTARLRSSMTIDRLARIARRFGDTYRRENARFAREAELWNGVRWQVLIEEPQIHLGLHLHALADPGELREEGLRMRNCVGSYVQECMRGKSQIWSVRKGDDSPVATLETRVRVSNSGLHALEIVQLKGVANYSCTESIHQAVNAMLADIVAQPHWMNDYLAWRQKVARRPMDDRQQHAVMLPIVAALQATLPDAHAWEKLVASPAT